MLYSKTKIDLKMADGVEEQLIAMRGFLDGEVAQRRLDRLASHFSEENILKEEQLSREVCAKLIRRSVNSSVLASLMAGTSADRVRCFGDDFWINNMQYIFFLYICSRRSLCKKVIFRLG